MSDFNKELGCRGEDVAVDYLKKQGYRIVQRNYKNLIGEIDIIAVDQKTYCFVEVKSRESLMFGTPQESVGLLKQKKISRVAECYVQEKNLEDEDCRFDVVTVLFHGQHLESIELYKDAFELG